MNDYSTIRTISGLEFEGSHKTSILDVAQGNGFHFESSCRKGQCGVCKTSLLQGRVVELQSQIALTDEDIKTGKVLTCCCSPASDILIDAEDLSALKNIEVKNFPARISNIVRHSEDIIEINLRLPPTAELRFLEGQYIEVTGPNGVKRSYSIANGSDERIIQLFIKKQEGGVLSQYWFHDAKVNDLLRIEGPKGSFFFRELRGDVVFLATGTGIAPVKSILDGLSKRTDLRPDLNIILYWGNRHPEDFFWKPEYETLKLNYIPVLSKKNLQWSGRHGYIQDVILEDGCAVKDSQFYACGSLQMIESAHNIFINNGMDEKYFHSDAFVSS